MSSVIAYTYEADLHCIACTCKRDRENGFNLDPAICAVDILDENGVRQACEDSEGNPVHPVFSTDEMSFNACGTCGEEIEAVRVYNEETEETP